MRSTNFVAHFSMILFLAMINNTLWVISAHVLIISEQCFSHWGIIWKELTIEIHKMSEISDNDWVIMIERLVSSD
jgi:hypothetical protein